MVTDEPIYEWNYAPGIFPDVEDHEHEWVEVTTISDRDRHWRCAHCPDWRVQVRGQAAEV